MTSALSPLSSLPAHPNSDEREITLENLKIAAILYRSNNPKLSQSFWKNDFSKNEAIIQALIEAGEDALAKNFTKYSE